MKTLKLKKVLMVPKITLALVNGKQFSLTDEQAIANALQQMCPDHRVILSRNLRQMKKVADIGHRGSIACVQNLDAPKVRHFIVEWAIDFVVCGTPWLDPLKLLRVTSKGR